MRARQPERLRPMRPVTASDPQNRVGAIDLEPAQQVRRDLLSRGLFARVGLTELRLDADSPHQPSRLTGRVSMPRPVGHGGSHVAAPLPA